MIYSVLQAREARKLSHISIIVPTYNQADALRETLRSVAQSDMASWDLMVVGDACTDHSEDVARAFDDPRIGYMDLADHTGAPQEAIKAALPRISGDVICLLNAGDLVCTTHLGECVAHLAQTGADVARAPVVFLTHDREGEPRFGLQPGSSLSGITATRRALAHALPPSEPKKDPLAAWIEGLSRDGFVCTERHTFTVLGTDALDSADQWKMGWDAIEGQAAIPQSIVAQAVLGFGSEMAEVGTAQPPATLNSDAVAAVAGRMGVSADTLATYLSGGGTTAAVSDMLDAPQLLFDMPLNLSGSEADQHLSGDWHPPERDGRWTAGARAGLRLTPPASGDAVVIARLRGLALQPEAGVAISVQGKPCLHHVFEGFDTIEVPLGQTDGTPVELGFIVEGINSPEGLGRGDDTRLLGIKLSDLALVRVDGAIGATLENQSAAVAG